MISLIIFISLLGILYTVSRAVSKLFFSIFYTTFRHSKFSVYLLSFVFLPGTIIHELSHFFMALILRVKTHDIHIFPRIEEDGKVKAGQVIISQTDPFRHTIIGVAPMIVGITGLFFIGEYFFPQLSRIIPAGIQFEFTWKTLLGIYLVFELTTTLFSSRRDLDSAIIVIPILLILALGLYFAGVRVSLEATLLDSFSIFISKVNTMLILGLIVQGIVYLILSLFTKFFLVRSHKKLI